MKEDAIRALLKPFLAQSYDLNLLAEEVRLLEIRADVVLLTPTGIHAFEIKSASDSPKRLPRQVQYYDYVCTQSTFVGMASQWARYRDHIPAHWGVILVHRKGHLFQHRKARPNPVFQRVFFTMLLWRQEKSDLLRKYVGSWAAQPGRALDSLIHQNIDAERLLDYGMKRLVYRVIEGRKINLWDQKNKEIAQYLRAYRHRYPD